MEFHFRSDWAVVDSGDAYVLEKGQLEYSVRIIKNDILEEIGELFILRSAATSLFDVQR